MELLIVNERADPTEQRLAIGDVQVFGSAEAGLGWLGNGAAISRRHAELVVTDLGFTIEATGTFAGIEIVDRSTPSRLFVPHGVGPIDIPFRECSIVVDLDGDPIRVHIHVIGSARADLWAEQWGIDAPPNPARSPQRSARTVTGRAALRDVRRVRKPNGAYYTWFVVLVALCEPAYDDPPSPAPTNKQLARRLGLREADVERKLASIYRALEIDANDRQRDLAVRRALANGIVTQEHLGLLDAPVPRRRIR